MGEVYRARDERLGREVAINVLLAESSADPDRLSRFEQEAKAAGALNHPNLVTVFDTLHYEGRRPDRHAEEPITFDLGVVALRGGAGWSKQVYSDCMRSTARPWRQSVTLSAGVARRVRSLARAKRASSSRVIAELVESGLQAQEAERERFLKLADRLTSSRDP